MRKLRSKSNKARSDPGLFIWNDELVSLARQLNIRGRHRWSTGTIPVSRAQTQAIVANFGDSHGGDLVSIDNAFPCDGQIDGIAAAATGECRGYARWPDIVPR